MADESQQPQRQYQGPYPQMWNLLNGDEDDRDAMLSEMSPDDRQRWMMKIAAPGSGFTPGDQYRFRQVLGLLPQVQQTTLLPPAPEGQGTMGRIGQAFGSLISGEMVGRARQRLGEVAQESGQLAQQYQTAAQGPTVAQGGQPQITGIGKDRRLTYGGIQDRGFGELVVNDLLSKLYETTGVGAKISAGFTDPKTLAAFIVSKLGPVGAASAAAYFGYQGTQGLADAIRSGKLTPESLQNGLLSMAGIAGSAAMGGEAGKGGIVPTKPAEIKSAVTSAVMEPMRARLRGISEARQGLRKQVFAAAQKYPEDVKAQAEAVRTAEGIKESRRSLESQSLKAKANVEGVEHRAWREGNERFEKTRELIGAGEIGEPEAPSEPLLDTVREAEAGLEGHPESITLFRQILKLEEDKGTISPGELRRATMEKHNIEGRYEDLAPDEKRQVDQLAAQEMKATNPVNWDKLQRIKTVAEEAMRKRSTPPAIKNALGLVDDKAVEMMGQMAETNPQASASWQGARDFWREWREDFHTPSGPKGSASPLTGIRDAVDPSYIMGEINRTQGVDLGNNRASATLRKPMYARHGGAEAADSVDHAVRIHRGIEETPPPSRQALQPVTEPVVDAEAASRKAIEAKAMQWGTMNKRDIGIIMSGVSGLLLGHVLGTIFGGKAGLAGDVGMAFSRGSSTVGGAFAVYEFGSKSIGRLLERPDVQAWLVKRVPPEEITALRKIPGADKVRVVNTITDMGVEAAKRGIIRRAARGGKTINMSPDLQNFIGNENVQKILAAVPTQRTPGQQIRDLRGIQEKFSANPNMPIGTE